jgi:hypothetical protein
VVERTLLEVRGEGVAEHAGWSPRRVRGTRPRGLGLALAPTAVMFDPVESHGDDGPGAAGVEGLG